MTNAKRARITRLYVRDFTPVSQGETEYVKKHNALIKLIEELVTSGNGDTIEVTNQMSLGDSEREFNESLYRIEEAELFLKIGKKLYHPVDLRTLQWRSG